MKKDYFDDWAQYLDEDEQRVYEEVLAWENRPERESNALQTVSLAVLNEVKKLPPHMLTATTDTIHEILRVLRDYSWLTISEEKIAFKISLKCNQRVLLDRSLEQVPVGILDEAARECIQFNIGAGCITGGVSGLLGLGGLLMDLPLLYGALFRLVQETAICYGYRIDNPEEKLYVTKILELGHIPDETSRRSTVTELHTLHTAIRGGVSLNQIERLGLSRGLCELAGRIGLIYSRRKIIAALMIAGGITGAGMNYLLAREVSRAAYHTYRKRFIMDRAMARRLKRI